MVKSRAAMEEVVSRRASGAGMAATMEAMEARPRTILEKNMVKKSN
jgi:hypothetical protein